MYVLRNEPFGGSVFNRGTLDAPRIFSDGTLIHLDDEAFAAVCKHVKGNCLSSDECKFIKELMKAEPWLENDGAQLRLTDLSKHTTIDYPFIVTYGPELADFQITYRCNSSCPHCYVDSQADDADASIDDIFYALDKMKEARVLQVAFGGGEPTLHPYFPQILRAAHDRGIVPNYTTNARLFTYLNRSSDRSHILREGTHANSPAHPAEILEATKGFCGAVAFSIEETGKLFEKRRGFHFGDFKRAAQHVGDMGINLVFQVTVGKDNIQRIPNIVLELADLEPYGILFLTYKPIGRGKSYDRPLAEIDAGQVAITFEKVFKNLHGRTSIGFDSCFAPALAHFAKGNINYMTYEGCTGGRTSLAISPELNVMPCSFMENLRNGKKSRWENLRVVNNFIEIWYCPSFENFRQSIASRMQQDTCANCATVENCLGGCPMMKLSPCT